MVNPIVALWFTKMQYYGWPNCSIMVDPIAVLWLTQLQYYGSIIIDPIAELGLYPKQFTMETLTLVIFRDFN